MSYCRVCGLRDEPTSERRIGLLVGDVLEAKTRVTVEYRPGKRQTLCSVCDEETPRKVDREAFDKRYWKGGDPSTVPEGTKREFYSDYLTSGSTLEKYIEETTKLYD